MRDLDTVRGFLSGNGPIAFFDLRWMPIYLAICFLFHTYIGLTALFGAIVLVTLTVITEVKTRHPTRSAAQFAVARNALLEASRRNAEAITAMGMVGRISKHWRELNHGYVLSSGHASDIGGGLGVMSKILRLLLQSAILAVSAWLVINQQSTPGYHCWFYPATPVQTARPCAAPGRPDAAQAADALAGRSKRGGYSARPAKSSARTSISPSPQAKP